MAGTGSSSPFIKDEPEDQFFSSHNQRYMGGTPQGFSIPQQHFNQFGSHGGSINPSDLTMGGSSIAIPSGGYGSSFQTNFTTQASNPNASFSKGISTFGDDELLDSLGTIHDTHIQSGGHTEQRSGLWHGFDFPQNIYTEQNGTNALTADPNHINGYSHTPDGDPIQSPFVHNFNHAQFRHMRSSITSATHCIHPLPTPGRRSKDQIYLMDQRMASQSNGLDSPR